MWLGEFGLTPFWEVESCESGSVTVYLKSLAWPSWKSAFSSSVAPCSSCADLFVRCAGCKVSPSHSYPCKLQLRGFTRARCEVQI